MPTLSFWMILAISALRSLRDTSREETRGKALLVKIAAQDRKAFEEFYYHYAQRIGHFLSKMLQRHDWVDEGVNDVMLTVWQSAGRFDPERAKVSTWLFGIAHNKGLKILERAGRRREMPLSEAADEYLQGENDDNDPLETKQDPSNPEQQVMGWQLGEALTWAISKLSEEHRCVIELSFNNNCSYQEIAEIMSCPENTVKTRMYHARKKLAEHLQRRGFDPTGQNGG